MAYHNIHIPYNSQCIHGMIYIMHEYFHAHNPSHSPTPSHMSMPSVAIVTGNANDTQIPSPCRLTNTLCNLPMGHPSRANPDPYHSTLGLSDKHDHVFSLRQQNFSDSTAGLSHPFGSFTPIQVFHTPLGILHPFQECPTHINYFSFHNLNYKSLLDVVPKTTQPTFTKSGE